MKTRIQERMDPARGAGRTEEILAQFGEAILVRVGPRIVLRGGSMADRTEALEWISMFMPDQVASVGK